MTYLAGHYSGRWGRSWIFLSPWVTFDLPSRFMCPQKLARNMVKNLIYKTFTYRINYVYILIQCRRRGLYFGPKTIFIPPPPSENDIFSPSRDTSFFDSHPGLFVLFLPYFAIILPFYFPFSHFLSPFFLFLSLFFLFLLHFPPFSLRLFIFFPPNDIGWYFPPPPRGGGYFPKYRPLCRREYNYSIILNFRTVEIETHRIIDPPLRKSER